MCIVGIIYTVRRSSLHQLTYLAVLTGESRGTVLDAGASGAVASGPVLALALLAAPGTPAAGRTLLRAVVANVARETLAHASLKEYDDGHDVSVGAREVPVTHQ